MALSDIFMCLTALPITPLYAFNGYWMFGETLCKILPAFQVHLCIHCAMEWRCDCYAGGECDGVRVVPVWYRPGQVQGSHHQQEQEHPANNLCHWQHRLLCGAHGFSILIEYKGEEI